MLHRCYDLRTISGRARFQWVGPLLLLACGGATTSENSVLAASSERESAETRRTAQGGRTAEPERRTETWPDDEKSFGLGNFLMPEEWPVLDIPDRGSSDTGNQNACPRQPVGIDSLLESMLDDLVTLEVEQRSFTRYVLTSNQFNSGACSSDLTKAGHGLNKLLNMTSTRPSVVEATQLEGTPTIYRIDLRDYGWDQELSVRGRPYANGWQAMVALNPYAVRYSGVDALTLRRLANAEIPWVYADSMANAVMLGDLYYAMIGAEGRTLLDFSQEVLGLDLIAEVDEGRAVLAGGTKGWSEDTVVPPSENFRRGYRTGSTAIQRSANFTTGQVLWATAITDQFCCVGESIFDYPLRFVGDYASDTTIAFSLPNQMLAHVVYDEENKVVLQGAALFRPPWVPPTPLSLLAWHALGFPLIVDEIRDVVEANRFNFNSSDFENVMTVYPEAEEFAAIAAADFVPVRTALRQAGIPDDVEEPVSISVRQFREPVGLQSMAGDLGVAAQVLGENLRQLPADLQDLDSKAIPRAVAADNFVRIMCQLPTSTLNRIDPAECAEPN